MPNDLTVVVIGASGDMARRLLFPALFSLESLGKLPEAKVVGYALERWGEEEFRSIIRESMEKFARKFSSQLWPRFASRLTYRSGDLRPEMLSMLKSLVPASALFYLALPPTVFAEAAEGLGKAGFHSQEAGWRRLVVEKPFGEDLASAQRLNEQLARYWAEGQIYRIDHFLGKETVQNLLVFRFANRFLEPILNSNQVAQVQITVAETLGLEGRYRYYDRIGALRDMIQNHLMQLFTLIAMEPPAVWHPEVLRDHKVEVLKAVHPISGKLEEWAARGQYTQGRVGEQNVPGYVEEQKIPAGSTTETFAAIKLNVDSWRWKGTPFYLRTGKRLKKDISEIALQFRDPPARLFHSKGQPSLETNWLIFRLKPDEAVDLVALTKRPGFQIEPRNATLHATYARPEEPEASAYEQLVLDVIEGDHTPFLRFDQVEWAWEILDPILKAWTSGAPETYVAGSEGPAGQNRILEPGHGWRSLI